MKWLGLFHLFFTMRGMAVSSYNARLPPVWCFAGIVSLRYSSLSKSKCVSSSPERQFQKGDEMYLISHIHFNIIEIYF